MFILYARNVFHSGAIMIRGILFTGVLIIFFVRVCDQAGTRQMRFSNSGNNAGTRSVLITENNSKKAEGRNNNYAFSLSNKKGEDRFRLTANAEPFITARSINP